MEKERSNKVAFVKKVFYWALMVVFVLWISNRAADFERVLELLRGAEYSWVILCLGLEIIYLFVYGSLYHYALKLTGYKPDYLKGIEAYISSLFLSVTTPLGGYGSAAYLARVHSKRIPIPLGGILSGIIFVMLAFNFSFLFLLIPTIIYLYNNDSQLFVPALTAGIIFTASVAVYWTVLFIAVKKPLSLKTIFFKLKRLYQKIWRISENSILALSDEKLEKNLQAYIIASKAIRQGNSNREVIRAFLLALSVHLYQFVVLYSVFNAFSIDASLKIILVSYTIFYLFAIVSPTPQGLGFVEGLMQVALISLGIPGEEGLVVTLVYRAINTWLPVLIGFAVFKLMGVTEKLSHKAPDVESVQNSV